MLIKPKQIRKTKLAAFTIIELMIVIAVIAILVTMAVVGATSLQKSSRDYFRDTKTLIISEALEKYYQNNGEYPSVAFMTSQDTAAITKKLGIKDAETLKLPLASSSASTSIVVSNPSPTQMVYSANTTDTSKSTQCQTSASGYCDGFQLLYGKEAVSDTIVVKSRHDSFTPITAAPTCNSGDTQNGSTCTRTYAATYQTGGYSCTGSDTLSGSTCTSTQSAAYSSGSSGYYYCPSGGTLSGSTCTTTSSYTATGTTACPSGYSPGTPGSCYSVANPGAGNSCPAGYTYDADWSERGGACVAYTSSTTTYSCPSGGTLSGSTCTTSSSYAASYSSGSSGYYYCPSGYTLSGTTCTKTYAATQGSGYYYCASGGTVSGITCTYTYPVQ